MTNRVVMGNKGGTYGLWVSKPGVNVLTASETDMLLSTSGTFGQIVRSGSFAAGTGTYSISWSALGFRPRLFFGTQMIVEGVNYTSDNSATVRTYNNQEYINEAWILVNTPTLSNRVYWFAINEAA